MEWQEHISSLFHGAAKEKCSSLAHQLTCWLSEHRGAKVDDVLLDASRDLKPYLEPLEGELVGGSLLTVPWAAFDKVHFNIVPAYREIPVFRWLLTLPGIQPSDTIHPKIDIGIYIDLCAELIMSAQKTVMISNPYWSEAAIIRLTNRMHNWVPARNTRVSIITRDGLETSDIKALAHLNRFLTMKGVSVEKLNLTFPAAGIPHAKFLVADSSKILLGSANLTHNGTTENMELSVFIQSEELVTPLVAILKEQFSSDQPNS